MSKTWGLSFFDADGGGGGGVGVAECNRPVRKLLRLHWCGGNPNSTGLGATKPLDPEDLAGTGRATDGAIALAVASALAFCFFALAFGLRATSIAYSILRIVPPTSPASACNALNADAT